jgi:hypothetical protein
MMMFAGFVWKCGQITESELEAIMHEIHMKLLSTWVQYPTSTCILFSGSRVMRLANIWVFLETNLLSVWNWSIFVNFWSRVVANILTEFSHCIQ